MALCTWVLALELRNASEISRNLPHPPPHLLTCGPGIFYYYSAQARKGALFGATNWIQQCPLSCVHNALPAILP
jgi:hypothetical protein